MNARPETVSSIRGAGGLYARVFDIAWRHAERMTHPAEASGTPRSDCHGKKPEHPAPERPEPTDRKTLGRPVSTE